MMIAKYMKWLVKINQKNVANAKIDFNRDYLNMTFKDIFSEVKYKFL